jgi:hypothetical protein
MIIPYVQMAAFARVLRNAVLLLVEDMDVVRIPRASAVQTCSTVVLLVTSVVGAPAIVYRPFNPLSVLFHQKKRPSK